MRMNIVWILNMLIVSLATAQTNQLEVGEKFDVVQFKDGSRIENVEVTKIQPDTITLMGGGQIKRAPITNLPEWMQARVDFDPAAAAAYAKARQEKIEAGILRAAQARATKEVAAERDRSMRENALALAAASAIQQAASQPKVVRVRVTAKGIGGPHSGRFYTWIYRRTDTDSTVRFPYETTFQLGVGEQVRFSASCGTARRLIMEIDVNGVPWRTSEAGDSGGNQYDRARVSISGVIGQD